MRILSLLFAQYSRQSGWLLKEWAVAERKLNNSVLSDLRCAEVKSGQSDGLRPIATGTAFSLSTVSTEISVNR